MSLVCMYLYACPVGTWKEPTAYFEVDTEATTLTEMRLNNQ